MAQFEQEIETNILYRTSITEFQDLASIEIQIQITRDKKRKTKIYMACILNKVCLSLSK